MKKSLLVVTLLVLGCSFAFAAPTFGFYSVSGGQYCNYEVLAPFAGNIWQGSDILTSCGASYNAVVVGIGCAQSKAQNPLGFALKGICYADNIYDAYSLAYTGAQWFVVSGTAATSCTARKKKFSWVGWAGISEVIFGYNYGCLGAVSHTPGNGKVSTGQKR